MCRSSAASSHSSFESRVGGVLPSSGGGEYGGGVKRLIINFTALPIWDPEDPSGDNKGEVFSSTVGSDRRALRIETRIGKANETLPERAWKVASAVSDVLDRLIAATQVRYPVIGDIARNLRFRYFVEPQIAKARSQVYDGVRGSLQYLVEQPDAPDYKERIDALVESAEPLTGLLAKWTGDGAALLGRLRLEQPAALTRGDRVILRSYSPPLTIGAATVLDPAPTVARIRSEAGLRRLRELQRKAAERTAAAEIEEQDFARHRQRDACPAGARRRESTTRWTKGTSPSSSGKRLARRCARSAISASIRAAIARGDVSTCRAPSGTCRPYKSAA